MMRVRSILAMAALLITTALASGPAGAAEGTQTYKLDPAHSYALFKVKHLGIGWSFGTFQQMEGQYTLDTANPEASSFEIKVAVASVDTGVEKRDKHLRSPDFFNAKQFPWMTFRSTAVTKTDEGYLVTGDLTIHGVTKKVSAKVKKTGETDDPWGNHRTALYTEFEIKRSDFGMTFMPKVVSDEVRIIVSAEGILQK